LDLFRLPVRVGFLLMLMRAGIVVVVSGGRFYWNKRHVYEVLSRLHAERNIVLVIQGQCKKGGADKLAETWAEENEVNCLSVPAKWRKLNTKQAGKIRNREMARLDAELLRVKIDVWVLFPGGGGTAHARMVAEEKRRNEGLEVIDLREVA
jgi:hypothetical protein